MRIEDALLERSATLREIVERVVQAERAAAYKKIDEPPPRSIRSFLKRARKFLKFAGALEYFTNERADLRLALLAYLIRHHDPTTHRSSVSVDEDWNFNLEDAVEKEVDEDVLEGRLDEDVWRAITVEVRRREISPDRLLRALEEGKVSPSDLTDAIRAKVIIKLFPRATKKYPMPKGIRVPGRVGSAEQAAAS